MDNNVDNEMGIGIIQLESNVEMVRHRSIDSASLYDMIEFIRP